MPGDKPTPVNKDWPGHVLVAGVMGSGKTWTALHLIGKQGAVFFDPNADAQVDQTGLQVIRTDWSVSAVRIWRLARPGWLVHYTPHSSASATAEISAICREAPTRRGQALQLVIDEAQQVAEQGKVPFLLHDLWDRGRHRNVQIILSTPVPQLVDYHLRLTASTKVLHRLEWSPWLSNWGLSEGELSALHNHDAIWLSAGSRKMVKGSEGHGQAR